MNEYIRIENARTNNLKDVSVVIPKNKIVVVTGVSGSGKSSLVFDTIASESQRLLNETYSSYIQSILPKYKKPDVDSISNLPVSLIINQKKLQGNARSTVGTITDTYSALRLLYSRIAKPFIGYSMKYSFNNPEGMCSHCKGLGVVKKIKIDRLIDFNKSLIEGAIQFPTFQNGGWRLTRYTDSGYFDNNKKISNYSDDELDLLLYSKEMKPINPTDNWHKSAKYIGLIPRITNSFINVENKKYEKELRDILVVQECPKCYGSRLNDRVLTAKISGNSIADCCKMSINELLDFIQSIENSEVSIILNDIKNKLRNLCIVGLEYLSLSRQTNTLSGGESQRIKMTRFLSSSLTDVLYIFDEPSIGLHPQDIKGISQIFKEIKAKGNSIIIVDHDPDIISIADHVINFGEGSGVSGGKITFQGSYNDLLSSKTVTAKALIEKPTIKLRCKNFSKYYFLENVSKYNIHNISIKIPKNALTLVTGVAGSGKSTLIRMLFKEKYPNSVILDQTPPHASSRSNLITYLNIYSEIKKLFAKENNLAPSLFSVTGKGACSECKGKGYIKLDLAFLGDASFTCEKCSGKRFNEDTLTYLYKGKNISEVFNLTAQEAQTFFKDNSVIYETMLSIIKANLGYIKLSQPLDTYSGGELQRLKIAQLLSTKTQNIIILDEPSTGLHENDIKKLIKLFIQILNEGNTLIVLEHNLSIISQAEWVIDLGSKGGNLGGKLLFQGYLCDFINSKKSLTAQHLKRYLSVKKSINDE